MKKVASYSLLSIILITGLLFVACGGGSSAGASLPDSEYTTHNPGGWGGGGSGNGAGAGEVSLQGGTPLNVSGYVYNGQTYPDIETLSRAMYNNNATGTFYVSFTTNGETRSARVTASDNRFKIEHQYKATYTLNGTTESVYYYKDDGISLTLPQTDPSVYTTVNGVDYHANGWSVAGQTYTGGAIAVAPDSGDMDLGTIEGAPDMTYGFSGGNIKVNATGTVRVDNTGRTNTITKINLPDSGSVALDLSGVTNLSLSGGTYNNQVISSSITHSASLTSVIMPSINYTLGEGAFYNCSSLSGSIDLSNCTSIGRDAFNGCSGLSGSIDLSNCTSIGNYAFKGCSSLSGVTFPNTAFTLDGSFTDCSSLSGTIDLSNCTSIGQATFQGCTGLTSVTFPNTAFTIDAYYTDAGAFQGCSGLSGPIDLSDCTSIGPSAFKGCAALSGSIDLSNCTYIGVYAFRQCSSISGVTLGSSITAIPDYAFEGCSSLSGTIDLSNCTSIGYGAFKDCSSLSGSIDLSNCTSIGYSAFQNCTGLTSVTFPNTAFSIVGASDINKGAFQNSGLSGTIDLSNCTSIGRDAFRGCSGISGTIDLSSCTSIGTAAFFGCNGISSVTLGSSITSIPEDAFNGCSGINGTIDLSNCTSIGTRAFYNCSNLSGTINLSNCTSIASYAFNGCSSLTGVTLGSGLTTVPGYAFYNVNATFEFNSDPTSITYNSFSFKNGVTATWNDNGNVHNYTWNNSSRTWVEN
ncbi:MAG: leucine-rich repeat domain-containing protein [Spirochaetaceae bacterium]|nr:leucine-rich repeat domain-containing protein [Spirochaetaceae bacterium]